MQHSNPYGSGSPNGPTPSVPLTVYRELAAELQATQAMLDSLHAQNQQLLQENQVVSQHNQQLQAEIAKVVNSTLHLRQVADSIKTRSNIDARPEKLRDREVTASPSPRMPRSPKVESNLRSDQGAELPPLYPASPHVPQSMDDASASSLFEDGDLHPQSWSPFGEDATEKGGVWLLVAIAAIVITAFGAGYSVVRPLLEQQQPKPSQDFQFPDP
ncbi:MAG: hypothetical protein J7641_23820 [Cyanobacteria bacterium SID2]|nr:hypothetical protein [Cyanobacteria bacterium SID2]MBP0005938.1 hypothetical protein [Cyanobacteria bacterium SBC]